MIWVDLSVAHSAQNWVISHSLCTRLSCHVLCTTFLLSFTWSRVYIFASTLFPVGYRITWAFACIHAPHVLYELTNSYISSRTISANGILMRKTSHPDCHQLWWAGAPMKTNRLAPTTSAPESTQVISPMIKLTSANFGPSTPIRTYTTSATYTRRLLPAPAPVTVTSSVWLTERKSSGY